MKKTDSQKADFFDRVFEVVAQIPYGRVTTYGAIARYLGIGGSARTVGWALNQSIQKDGPDLPCHRVINRLGQLSGKVHFGPGVMEALLQQEGIEVKDDTVDLDRHFWDPADEMRSGD